MKNLLINVAVIVPTIAVIYFVWLRPILMQRPSLVHFYEAEGSLFEALRGRFVGIRQRVTGVVMVVGAAVLELHDSIAPLIGAVDVTPITSLLPPWAWTLVVIASIWLLDWLRKLNDERPADVAEEIDDKIEKATVVEVAADQAKGA